jgi:hypothetical protein
MTERTNRNPALRALNAICATAIIVTAIFMLMAGFNIIALAVIVGSIIGLAVPVAAAAEGVLEALAGIFEAIADGITAIFEAIASLFSDLF